MTSRQRRTIALAALATLVPSAQAFMPDAAFVQFGAARHTGAAVVGAGWDFGRSWTLRHGVITGFWELMLGHWRTSGPDGNEAIVSQIGITPVFRLHRSEESRWFLELGIGATFTTPLYQNRDKRFSTSFNFGDHIAAGYRFGAERRHELALRLQHFSNGGIRHPNPGENFIQLRYTRRLH